MTCQFCPPVKAHTGNTKSILKTPRTPVSESFRTTPLYCVYAGAGEENVVTVETIEEDYKDKYPKWDKECQSFPPGSPLYFDKLEKTKPWERARDIEKSLNSVNKSILPITTWPWVETKIAETDDNAVVETIAKSVLDSLMPTAKILNIKQNVIDGLKKMVKGHALGKLGELKDCVTVEQALNELQDKTLDELVKKSRDWQNLSERKVSKEKNPHE